ncbi:MAG: hypothetical protein ACRCW9_09705 [Cetobacterium sp.]
MRNVELLRKEINIQINLLHELMIKLLSKHNNLYSLEDKLIISTKSNGLVSLDRVYIGKLEEELVLVFVYLDDSNEECYCDISELHLEDLFYICELINERRILN